MGDNETMALINQTYQRADAFLFGRRTYELFADYWGADGESPRRGGRSGQQPDRGCLELDAQIPCIDHGHRTGLDEHHPSIR